MSHKYTIGTSVYFDGDGLTPSARGIYKILRALPIERDNRVLYRIKTSAEAFERLAEERQLTRAQ